jgi:hypothetical protein
MLTQEFALAARPNYQGPRVRFCDFLGLGYLVRRDTFSKHRSRLSTVQRKLVSAGTNLQSTTVSGERGVSMPIPVSQTNMRRLERGAF